MDLRQRHLPIAMYSLSALLTFWQWKRIMMTSFWFKGITLSRSCVIIVQSINENKGRYCFLTVVIIDFAMNNDLYYRNIKKKTVILQILQLNGHCFLNNSCYFKIIIIILKSRCFFWKYIIFSCRNDCKPWCSRPT